MNVTAASQLDIYCESAPLADNQLGYGLSRAMVPIIKALYANVDRIIVAPCDGIARVSMIAPEFKSKTLILSNFLAMLIARVERRFPKRSKILSRAWMRISAWFAPKSSAKYILAVIGANQFALQRASSLAKNRGQLLLVYFVDDLILPMRQYDQKTREYLIKQIIDTSKNVEKSFCITQALAERFMAALKIEATELKLPYVVDEADFVSRRTSKSQLIHVGAVNFLYAQALEVLIGLLDEFNHGRDDKIYLRFTIEERIFLSRFKKKPEWVVCQPIPDRSLLLQEVADSAAAILPYSFDPAVRVMVETSFPSKFLDYLCGSRSIAVFAPDYSSISRYAKGCKAISILSSRESLHLYLQEIVAGNVENRQVEYRQFLKQEHSPKTFGQALMTHISAPK